MKKFIVLDIDATLVHTHGDDEEYIDMKFMSNSNMAKYRKRIYSMKLSDVTTYPGSGEELKLYGIYRPHLKEFLEFCFRYFEGGVIIWSAGKKKYVEKMCELMFVDRKKQPLVIYNYDDCDIYDDRIHKPLTKLYNDKRISGMNETNTYVIDDRNDTFALNKGNGVMIPEFEANMDLSGLKKSDDNLLKLMGWFMSPEVRNTSDARTTSKTKIFNTSTDEYLKMLDK